MSGFKFFKEVQPVEENNMEELLKALRLIKDTCADRTFCRTCPMRCQVALSDTARSYCAIRNSSPAQWKLVDAVSEVKLFKEVARVKEMENLLEALRCIRYICEQQEECCHCPLCDANEECVLGKEAPACWKLVEKVPETRLFREEA